MLNQRIPYAYAKSRHFVESDLFKYIDGRHSLNERHGNCENPVKLIAWGSREQDLPGRNDLFEQVTTVRCRKCGGCMRYRVAQVVSVCSEMANLAARTKFVTLTVGPGWRNKSDDFLVAEMQRYIKKVRAVAPPFVYAWVVEYGAKRGRIHAHIMFFEGPAPVTNTHLRGRYLKKNGLWKKRWKWGTIHIKIAKSTSHAAWYLVKYIRKDPATRFRRSVGRQPR